MQAASIPLAPSSASPPPLLRLTRAGAASVPAPSPRDLLLLLLLLTTPPSSPLPPHHTFLLPRPLLSLSVRLSLREGHTPRDPPLLIPGRCEGVSVCVDLRMHTGVQRAVDLAVLCGVYVCVSVCLCLCVSVSPCPCLYVCERERESERASVSDLDVLFAEALLLLLPVQLLRQVALPLLQGVQLRLCSPHRAHPLSHQSLSTTHTHTHTHDGRQDQARQITRRAAHGSPPSPALL
eukprot:766811-Rhodomonas_salina.1